MTIIANNFVEPGSVVASLANSHIIIKLGFVFLVALLEALFFVTFYWPGTVILIAAVIILPTHNTTSLYVLSATAGTITGVYITWWIFSRIPSFMDRIPHAQFAVTAGNIFPRMPILASAFLAVQPSFLSSFYAFLGLNKIKVQPFLLVSTVSTLLIYGIYSIISQKLANYFGPVQAGHGYVISLVLFLIGCLLCLRCFLHQEIVSDIS